MYDFFLIFYEGDPGSVVLWVVRPLGLSYLLPVIYSLDGLSHQRPTNDPANPQDQMQGRASLKRCSNIATSFPSEEWPPSKSICFFLYNKLCELRVVFYETKNCLDDPIKNVNEACNYRKDKQYPYDPKQYSTHKLKCSVDGVGYFINPITYVTPKAHIPRFPILDLVFYFTHNNEFTGSGTRSGGTACSASASFSVLARGRNLQCHQRICHA